MRAAILALALALPSRAGAEAADPGPVAVLTAAARLLPQAIAGDDALAVAAAVRLARSVRLRPAAGWQRAGPEADPPAAAGYPRDPGTEAAAVLAGLLAEGDGDLAALVAEALAAAPADRGSAATTSAVVPPGGTHLWTLPFYGRAPAEAGVQALGPGALVLTVTEAGGAAVCAPRLADPAALCGFVPDRNGWFDVAVHNPGVEPVVYRLATN
jgi:hypothetical protein